MKHFSSRWRAAHSAPTIAESNSGRLSQPKSQTLLRALGLLIFLVGALGARAQQRSAPLYFQEDAAAQRAAASSPLAAALRSSRPFTLNVGGLQTALAAAPLAGRAGTSPVLLTLPLPDGTSGRFQVVEAPLLAPNLIAQYPSIKTYGGVGVDDPTATVQLDVTPRGFHAQILSDRSGTVYIDPVTRTDTQHYLSFARSAMPAAQLNCGVTEHVSAAAHRSLGGGAPRTAQRTSGTSLRTFRLAVATTGEYTTFQGGTAALGYAAVVTTVNRVRGVYEKELAVSFTLVSSSATVYTNASTDPYTNTDPDALLTQNQANLDNASVIGTANYDIGHVFSTAGGGLAGLGVICVAGEKAQGETGTSSPVGDSFDIDYVAHEMGHQSGANHTFNADGTNSGSCQGNRNTSTAYEPGAGTTIMAYAGICGSANNTQNNSDAYFHVASYEEIQAYLATTSCGTTTANSNTVPTVTLPASGKVLPIGTPFKLTAVGSDASADALTYCWEEYDLGTAGSPTAAQVADNDVPLFRSFSPSSSATRYFPRLSDIIANTSTLGERLPTVTRDLNFRVTLRDRYTTGNTGTGVVGSVNSSAVVALTSTNAAGPFLVTAPNTAVSWAANSSQTVTWNIAGTTTNGVNCATVNIRLSTDGGLTYPTLLLAGTANDGSAAIMVPGTASTQARIMVEAADNYFFDISNANFTITAGTACNPPTGLSVGSITATTATVSFTASGAATSYTVTTAPATTTQTVTGTSANLTGLLGGTQYTVYVQSSCAASAVSTTASTTFITAAPPVCNPVTGATVGSITATSATVSFTASAGASNYVITTSPATTTQTVTTTSANLTGLTAGTSYTVNIVTNCSNGGTATTSVTFGTPPANDNCAGAINLISGTSCSPTAGSVTGATQSQAASSCNGATSTTAFDVWYSFVAASAAHTVTLNSPNFDGVVQVFSGSCGSLSSVSCRDAAGAGIETLSLTGLTTNARYYIRVYPYNTAPTAANAGFTICVTGTVAPTCAAPTALSAGSITNTSASISFTANAQGASYTVTTAPATTTQTITTSPASLTGLTAGTAYTVSIATNCQNGVTSTAATTSFTTTNTAACAAPTGVSTSSVTSASAAVSWTASASATSYTVTTSPATTSQTVSGTSATLSGLTPGTAYTVSVVSNCSGGATSSAATATFTTGVCAAPTSLNVSAIQSTSATVTFTASASATSYTVTTTPATTSQTVTTNTVNLTGLTANTAYTVSIVSNCSGGGTAAAATASFTTSVAAPANNECAGAIGLTSATSCNPTNGTVTGATQSQTPLNCGGFTSTTAQDVWYSFVANGTTHTITAASSTLDGVLELFSGTCASLSSLGCADAFGTGATENLTLTTLTNGSTYYVRYYPYTASTTAVTGNFTICVTNPVPPCNAATGVAVSSITATSATVTYTASASATSYTITTSPATTTQTVTGISAPLSGLTPSTTYTVSVVSNCAGGATSAAATQTFVTTAPAAAATTTALSSNLNPSSFGQTVTLTAGVSSGNGTPGGTVTFFDGTTSLGTATLSGGSTTLNISSLSVGSHSLTATYGGATGFNSSSSATLTQVVNPASTTTTLTSGPNPSTFGQSVALTATVSPVTATGSVSFYNGATLLGNATLSSGVAVLNTSSLPVGSHSLTAIYSGSSTFATSTSAATTQVVNPASTTTTLTSNLNPSTFGQSVTLTATLSPTAATGTVTFFDGATSLGTGQLNAGVATLSTNALSGGSHSLTAMYGGSANYAGSTSATLAQVVNAATPTISSLNPTSGTVGTTVVISGSNLTGITAISFNGTAATFTANSATSVTTTVPAGAASGNVTVTTAGGTSNGLAFTVTLSDLLVTTPTTIPTSSYNNVTITGTGTLTLTGPLNVAGAMTVQNGGTFITNYNLVQGSGSFALEAGATLQVFDLAGLSASGTTGSIQNTGSRSFSIDANYIYRGIQAQVTGAGLPATVRNLTLNNSGGVTLSGDVSIHQALTPAAGTFTTTGRVLTLLSDAGSTAYVAYTRPTAGSISGNITVQRYVDGSLNAGPGYRHFSAPVTTTTINDLAAGSFAPVVNPAYNTAAQPSLTVPYPTVFGYDQSRIGTVTNNLLAFDKGWVSPAALTTAMTSGQGYTAHTPGGITVDFVGLPAQANLTKANLDRGTDAQAGWQLLGNPYPAPINWDSLRLHGGLTGLDNALYVFKSSGSYMGSYASYVNGIATNNGGPVLPLGQGFFVRTSTAGSTGQLTFHNTDRLNTSAAPAFQRGTADARPLLRLALSGTTGNPDETVVYFENGATATGPDAAFDAAKLLNPGAVLSLASQMTGPGNEALAINGLPLPTAPATSVPLTLQVPAVGAYHFAVTALSGFDASAPITLLDHALNTRTDLRLTPAYAFVAAQAGAVNGRFELLLGRPGTVTATAGAGTLQFSVWPNPASHKAALHVQLEQAATTATITLRDVLGRSVAEHRFGGSSTELPTAKLAAGTYLLTVQVSGQAPATRRVVVE